MDFDFEGRENAIQKYETEIKNKLINPIVDLDTTKFSHSSYTQTVVTQTTFTLPNGNTITTPVTFTNVESSINYECYFYDYLTGVTSSTVSNWATDYENVGFTDSEIYYFSNSFKGSFFKLDFYDTKNSENQTLYFSIILPTQQGLKEPGIVGPTFNQTNVEVKKPKFILDSIGKDKEGYFIYWLKNKDFLPSNDFYCSVKFFDAKKGQFIRMINRPQSNFSGINMFNLDQEIYFYLKYSLDYNSNEYLVFDENNNTLQRLGTSSDPIKWYEYVNP
jgi:hypothetical protein